MHGVEISSDFAVRYFSSERLSVKYSAAIMITTEIMKLSFEAFSTSAGRGSTNDVFYVSCAETQISLE